MVLLGKCFDYVSLKLKVVVRCGDPKLLVEAKKSYWGAKNVNTKDCALKGSDLCDSTKQKRHVAPNADCNSHRPNKVQLLHARLLSNFLKDVGNAYQYMGIVEC